MKLGKVYLVKFLDHTLFSGAEGAPIECEAIGRLFKISKQHIELTSWTALKEGWENNNEGACIVRACITYKKELK